MVPSESPLAIRRPSGARPSVRIVEPSPRTTASRPGFPAATEEEWEANLRRLPPLHPHQRAFILVVVFGARLAAGESARKRQRRRPAQCRKATAHRRRDAKAVRALPRASGVRRPCGARRPHGAVDGAAVGRHQPPFGDGSCPPRQTGELADRIADHLSHEEASTTAKHYVAKGAIEQAQVTRAFAVIAGGRR
ncbi:MAG: hypothetical protein JWN44_4776 [Myxococcales bacterium]|nr:hypothetical protein [Myxococcales bacterium]